jgi:carbonic anhydrase
MTDRVPPSESASWRRFVRTDLPASLVVFLIALPLTLGIAVASGATVQAGLIAAVAGGIVVGAFGGAPLQVSGPAAGLTVMVSGFVQKFGLPATAAITAAAGVLQVVAGLGGVARAALALSPAVLHAMLAGIGVLISLGQVHVLFGSKPKGSAFENLAGLGDTVSHANVGALVVGLVTLGVIVAWRRFAPKRLRFLPGSLVAIVTGTVVSMLLPREMPRVAVDGNLLAGLGLPSLGGAALGDAIVAALSLALVASAESLLCAVATDQLHSGPRANLDRELVAQGMGNTVSGLLGGLPVTGVIVRSSANIAAGARTRLSPVLHGVWLLVFVVFLSGLLKLIPMAALAALLVHVGVNLVKPHQIRHVRLHGDGLVYVVTFVGVVFINLLWGIGIGLGLALVILLRRVSRVRCDVRETADGIEVELAGHLSFLSVPAVVAGLSSVPAGRMVRLKLDVAHLDHAVIEALRGWSDGYRRAGGTVAMPSWDELRRHVSRA